MISLPKNAALFLFGFLGLASLATVSSLTLTADAFSGLRNLEIRPYGDFVIDPGEHLLMSAEGTYATYSIPLRAAWSIVQGEDLGFFVETCDSAKTCDFQAGNEGGEVMIRAQAEGIQGEAVIHIRKPEPPTPVQSPFSDTIPDWSGEAVVTLQKQRIIRGYEDGTFGAGDLLTRGQMITIFHRTLKQLNLFSERIECGQVYNDIPPEHYAFEAACALRQGNYMDSLSTLNPDDRVTRGETASLLNRVIGPSLLRSRNLRLGNVLAQGPYFRDIAVSHQYYGDTAVTKATGLMQGNPDGTFEPGTTLNRAQAATIFFRVMNEVKAGRVTGL